MPFLRRPWKILLASTVLLVIIVVLGMQLLVHLRFNEPLIRQHLSSILTEQGRTIQINGKVAPSIFPTPSVNINNITISEPYSSTSFASIENLSIRFGWWDLLQGEPKIQALTLNGASANVTRNPNGFLSIMDLLLMKPKKGNFSFDLDNINIENSALHLLDEKTQTHYQLSNIQIDINQLKNQAHLNSKMQLVKGSEQIGLSLQTPLEIQQNQIQLQNVALQAKVHLNTLGNSLITLSGKYLIDLGKLTLTGEKTRLHFTAEQPQLSLESLFPKMEATLHKASLSNGSLQIGLIDGKNTYQLSASLAHLDVTQEGLFSEKIIGHLNWQNGKNKLNVQLQAPLTLFYSKTLEMSPIRLVSTLTTPLLPREQLTSTLEGSLKGTLNPALLNLQVAGDLDGSEMKMELRQYGLLHPRYETNLVLDRLDLNRYLPKHTGIPVAIFENTDPISLDWLDFFDVSGKIAIDELIMGRFKINNINSYIHINPEEFELNQLSANIYNGYLEGDISFSRNQGVPHLQVKQTLSGMEIRPVLVDLFDFGRLTGKGSAAVDVVANGASFSHLRNTLSGTAKLSLTHGALTGIDLVAALKNLPTELKEWNSTDKADQRTPFSTLSSSYRLDHGVARSQDLRLASDLVNVQGSGKLDLVKNILDYSMNVQANPTAFSRLKNINIPLKITGHLNAPVYALDFNAIVKGKKTETEKQQALKQQLKKQITTIIP